MTLTQLEYLIAVADSGNFTIAAEKSFVTQPTLSMQMQKLEEELEVEIFNRKTKPIGLTNVGQKIVDQARVILNESQRMQDVIAQEKGLVGGRFRLGIIPTVMPTLLPLFMNDFLKNHPKVVLEIQELNTENILKALTEGQLDAGIAATPLQQKNILERILYYEPFIGYVPQNHSLHPLEALEVEDLSSNPLLVLEDGHCFRNQTLNLCAVDNAKENSAFDLKSGSFETLVRLSDQGLGMTLLPYLHTREMEEQQKKNLRPFKNPSPARAVSIIYAKSQIKLPVINALHKSISGIIRGAITYEDYQVITPNLQA
ncbi:MAG: hydrogen peroxide-inducible genes activator [Flavobacteriaceae bacterium]